MTNHPTSLIPGYVLGALPPDEARAVGAHLAICPACRREADAFRAGLADDAPGAGPMPRAHVRQALLARVAASQARARAWSARGAWAASIGMLVAALALGAVAYSQAQERALLLGQLADQQRQIATLQAQLGQEADLVGFLSDPATASRVLPATDAGTARAVVYMREGHRRVVVLGHGLGPLDSSYTYQLWLAAPGQQVPASTFTPGADGSVAVVFDAPAPIDQYSQLMITIEPAGGAAHPSQAIVFAVEL